ncbi:Lin1244/Lin1753 domain-containing protein [Selenomonas ruminantium]|uniref:Lin1244/Lin1753 domain-containing protein n=1 Tax=Selenomonas ruminantium TaxID=971 RepID=UPI000409A8B8|nr:Lin1244/Lin1753 domain-containing protein [Selenomonas ruminantium]
MARPQKEGLDYFPLDTDIAEDEKILYLEAETGLEGFAIYVKLLSTIYRNSYYMMWTETQLSIYSRRFFVDKNTLSTVVSVCKNIGLFDKKLFEKYQILTSHGIQSRYLMALERRSSIKMIDEFCLLDKEKIVKSKKVKLISAPKQVSAYNNPHSTVVFVDNNPAEKELLHTKTPQSKVKKSISSCCSSPYSPPEENQPDEETELAEKDDATARVFDLFQDNIHPITGQIETDTLTDLLDHYGEQWLTEAIRETALNNGHSVKYIKSILEAWERNGFKAEKPERSKDNGGRPQSNARRNKKQSTAEAERAKWANETSGWD